MMMMTLLRHVEVGVPAATDVAEAASSKGCIGSQDSDCACSFSYIALKDRYIHTKPELGIPLV